MIQLKKAAIKFMTSFKGGRGRKAPYQTTMVRIPMPIKPLVELLVKSFRMYVAEHGLTENACLEFMQELHGASTGNPSKDINEP